VGAESEREVIRRNRQKREKLEMPHPIFELWCTGDGWVHEGRENFTPREMGREMGTSALLSLVVEIELKDLTSPFRIIKPDSIDHHHPQSQISQIQI
jgi:hypothetical protein